MNWYQASTNYFCCGVAESNGVVVRAAPILRWALGKPIEVIRVWLEKKGGTLVRIEAGEEE